MMEERTINEVMKKAGVSTTKTVSLRLSKGVFDHVKKLADQDDRSFNYMVEKLLKQAITNI